MTETAPSAPLRLLVVDDHEVVRQGLAALLARRERFHVVGEAGSVAQALEAARSCLPDLVVMGARLPDGSGIAACRAIRAAHPATRVVILTGYADPGALFGSVLAGASGYLLKQSRSRDLVAALEAVGRGESLFDPTLTGQVRAHVRRTAEGMPAEPVAALTSQEQQILHCIAAGKTNKQIAAELSLPLATVKQGVSSILAKLRLQRRAQAAAFAAGHQLPGLQ